MLFLNENNVDNIYRKDFFIPALLHVKYLYVFHSSTAMKVVSRKERYHKIKLHHMHSKYIKTCFIFIKTNTVNSRIFTVSMYKSLLFISQEQ